MCVVTCNGMGIWTIKVISPVTSPEEKTLSIDVCHALVQQSKKCCSLKWNIDASLLLTEIEL